MGRRQGICWAKGLGLVDARLREIAAGFHVSTEPTPVAAVYCSERRVSDTHICLPGLTQGFSP